MTRWLPQSGYLSLLHKIFATKLLGNYIQMFVCLLNLYAGILAAILVPHIHGPSQLSAWHGYHAFLQDLSNHLSCVASRVSVISFAHASSLSSRDLCSMCGHTSRLLNLQGSAHSTHKCATSTELSVHVTHSSSYHSAMGSFARFLQVVSHAHHAF